LTTRQNHLNLIFGSITSFAVIFSRHFKPLISRIQRAINQARPQRFLHKTQMICINRMGNNLIYTNIKYYLIQAYKKIHCLVRWFVIFPPRRLMRVFLPLGGL
jgi:hypothetical protein